MIDLGSSIISGSGGSRWSRVHAHENRLCVVVEKWFYLLHPLSEKTSDKGLNLLIVSTTSVSSVKDGRDSEVLR